MYDVATSNENINTAITNQGHRNFRDRKSMALDMEALRLILTSIEERLGIENNQANQFDLIKTF